MRSVVHLLPSPLYSSIGRSQIWYADPAFHRKLSATDEPGRQQAGKLLDSAQKGSYDLGLPLPGPARLSACPGGNPLSGFPSARSRRKLSGPPFHADSASACERSSRVEPRGRKQECRLLSCPAPVRRSPTSTGTSSMPTARSSAGIATVAARLLQGKHKAIYTPVHRHRRSRRRRQRGARSS